MHQLGIQLSAHLRAGDLVLVNGPLGAGKTVLAQGVGAGLGITGITSPTFVISRVH
jgi:tRNA threonylcarbamoyladenosine biosynthesis protein TsaE